MTLPAGTISLSQVNTELSLSSTQSINLNNATVRTLAGVGGSGTQFAMSSLRGKSSISPIFYGIQMWIIGAGGGGGSGGGDVSGIGGYNGQGGAGGGGAGTVAEQITLTREELNFQITIGAVGIGNGYYGKDGAATAGGSSILIAPGGRYIVSGGGGAGQSGGFIAGIAQGGAGGVVGVNLTNFITTGSTYSTYRTGGAGNPGMTSVTNGKDSYNARYPGDGYGGSAVSGSGSGGREGLGLGPGDGVGGPGAGNHNFGMGGGGGGGAFPGEWGNGNYYLGSGGNGGAGGFYLRYPVTFTPLSTFTGGTYLGVYGSQFAAFDMSAADYRNYFWYGSGVVVAG